MGSRSLENKDEQQGCRVIKKKQKKNKNKNKDKNKNKNKNKKKILTLRQKNPLHTHLQTCFILFFIWSSFKNGQFLSAIVT
jgi:hypothetical protein